MLIKKAESIIAIAKDFIKFISTSNNLEIIESLAIQFISPYKVTFISTFNFLKG